MSVAVYRAIVFAIEKQRVSLGVSMAQVNEIAGVPDGYYAKMLYPDTPSGRQAQWQQVQDVIEALFGADFALQITPSEAENRRVTSAPIIDKGMSTNALQNRHWRHRKHFVELGKKGAAARDKVPKRKLSAIYRKAARNRWKRVRAAQRQGAAHAKGNAEKLVSATPRAH